MDEELESKILRKVFIWMVAGGIGVGGVAGSGIIRVGKFTSQDAELLEQRMTFKCREMELDIRKDMPPLCTRRRILNIEHFLEEKYPEFDRTELCW